MLGRASIEAVLRLSSTGIACPPHPCKKGGAVGFHGSERGTVTLAERELRLIRPRARILGIGETCLYSLAMSG